jgi:two-component system, NarL family, response regulator NreC
MALLDLTMPRVGGMRALQIVRTCHETRVLVLTMHNDPAYLRSVLAAGASGLHLLDQFVHTGQVPFQAGAGWPQGMEV